MKKKIMALLLASQLLLLSGCNKEKHNDYEVSNSATISDIVHSIEDDTLIDEVSEDREIGISYDADNCRDGESKLEYADRLFQENYQVKGGEYYAGNNAAEMAKSIITALVMESLNLTNEDVVSVEFGKNSESKTIDKLKISYRYLVEKDFEWEEDRYDTRTITIDVSSVCNLLRYNGTYSPENMYNKLKKLVLSSVVIDEKLFSNEAEFYIDDEKVQKAVSNGIKVNKK